jgi:hypothetical protein
MTRTPYPEREDVLDRWCSCGTRIVDGYNHDLEIPEWRTQLVPDAECPIHSPDPAFDTPEDW